MSLKFSLNQLAYPPIIIVLEMMQDQSLEETLVFWDSEGKFPRLNLTAKAPFKEKEKPIKMMMWLKKQRTAHQSL